MSNSMRSSRTTRDIDTQRSGCFVAGTLVHTRDGVRPICELKVGDLVLSRADSGDENAYKKVVRTIKHQQRKVVSTKYSIINPRKKPLAPKFHLISTTDHLYWLENSGWLAAGQIYYDSGEVANFQLARGEIAWYRNTANVYATDTELVYVPDQQEIDEGGRLFNLDKAELLEMTPYNWERWAKNGKQAELALCDVYNIEVEDYHSYFVGEHGIWVQGAHAQSQCGP